MLLELNKKRNNADKQLYLMERARLASLSGEVDQSIADFTTVIKGIQIDDDKAIISMSAKGGQAASLLTNDNAIPYAVQSYEKVFVHQYQSLNYLRQGNLEGAIIEVRRANFIQHEAAENYHREIANAQEKAEKNQLEVQKDDYAAQFASMDAAVGKVKNSFQNAYTFYTSGVIFEMDGSRNDAYIDYKKALQIYPANRYLQQDVLRLAYSLGMREDYARYSKQFGSKAIMPKKGSGSVVVLYEQGFTPMKQEIKIPIPTIHGIFMVAFPTYSDPWVAAVPLQVFNKTSEIGVTDLIVDVYALAAKSMEEKRAGMLVRQALRAVAKYEVQKQAGDQYCMVGFAAQLYNIVSENADRRSWLTLPSNAQTLRTSLEPGVHTLNFKAGQLQQSFDVNVKLNKITIIRVVNSGMRMIVDSVTL